MEALRKNAEATMATEVEDPWLSVPKAAKLLGISNPTVRTLALHGKIRAQLVGGLTFIHRDSIDAYLARRDADTSDTK